MVQRIKNFCYRIFQDKVLPQGTRREASKPVGHLKGKPAFDLKPVLAPEAI
jgi:hypothetical protein